MSFLLTCSLFLSLPAVFHSHTLPHIIQANHLFWIHCVKKKKGGQFYISWSLHQLKNFTYNSKERERVLLRKTKTGGWQDSHAIVIRGRQDQKAWNSSAKFYQTVRTMNASMFLLRVRGFLSTIWVLGFCKGLEKRNYTGTWRKLEDSSELCLLYRNFFVAKAIREYQVEEWFCWSLSLFDFDMGSEISLLETVPSSQLWHQRNLLCPLISPSPSWFPISESLKLPLFSLSFLKEPPSTIEDAREASLLRHFFTLGSPVVSPVWWASLVSIS